MQVMAERQFDPGLPHGRLWVARMGCRCEPCEARLVEEGIDAAARARVEAAEDIRQERIAKGARPTPRPVSTKVTFRKKKSGQYVVVGPVDQIRPGQVALATNITTGRVREVFVTSVGRRFVKDGVEQCYGYTRR